MTTYEKILHQLRSGTLLTQAMFEEYATEPYAEALWWSATAGSGVVGEEVERALKKRRSKALKAEMTEQLCTFDDEVERVVTAICSQIAGWKWKSASVVVNETKQAFNWIASVALLGIEDPFFNWLWLCYKAGHLPYGSYPVEGRFTDLVDVSSKEAFMLLEAAQQSRERTRSLIIQRAVSKAAERVVAADADRRCAECVESLMRAERPMVGPIVTEIFELTIKGASVRTLPDDLVGVDVPASWLALLKAQAEGREIPWDMVWRPATDWFSKVREFVVTKCFGIAVLTKGDSSPTLAYLFVLVPGSAIVYEGGRPLGATDQSKSAERLRAADVPDDFKRFYEEVHSHFAASPFGSINNAGLSTLDGLISEEDAFRDLDSHPFALSDLAPVYDHGNGDYICLNLKRSTPKTAIGGWYWHEDVNDSKFDEEVKELVNKQFEDSRNEYRLRGN